MADNMSLLGGFLRGSAQAKMMGPKREQEKELNALKKQMIQLQLSNAKIKQQELKMKSDLMQRFFQKGDEQKQTSQAAQTSDDFDPLSRGAEGATESVDKSKLVEAMAGGGMSPEGMDMSPQDMALIKSITGIDFLGAGRLEESRERGDVLERQGGERNLMRMLSYMLSRQKGSYFDKPIPAERGGGTEQVFRSAYGPGGPGGPDAGVPGGGVPSLGATPGVQPGVQGKPPASTLPVPPANLSQWRNSRMEMPSKPGQSPAQLMEQGFRPVNIGSISKAESIIMGMEVMTELEGMMEKVFPDKEGGFADKFIKGPARMVGAFLQTDPDARALQSYVNMTLAPLIRTLGEKGALSDTDVKRAIKGMPSLFSGGKVAWKQVELLNNLLERASQSVMGLQFGKPSKPDDLSTMSDEEILNKLGE